jgi:hypothetical protein
MEKFHFEKQRGKYYEIKDEKPEDTLAATIGFIYLIFMTGLFIWQLIDIWTGRYFLANKLGYELVEDLEPGFLILFYTFIGGALGGIANEVRGILLWHCEYKAYKKQYIWKTIVSPWIGGTLGIFVFALIRSGIGVFEGDFMPSEESLSQVVSMFALGALSGYGARKVFIWLDAQVNRIFKIKTDGVVSETHAQVPSLAGKTKEEASSILQKEGLVLGKEIQEPQEDEKLIDKIVGQNPEPGIWIKKEEAVNITLGIKKGQQ